MNNKYEIISLHTVCMYICKHYVKIKITEGIDGYIIVCSLGMASSTAQFIGLSLLSPRVSGWVNVRIFHPAHPRMSISAIFRSCNLWLSGSASSERRRKSGTANPRDIYAQNWSSPINPSIAVNQIPDISPGLLSHPPPPPTHPPNPIHFRPNHTTMPGGSPPPV